jgi:hypothetical protein
MRPGRLETGTLEKRSEARSSALVGCYFRLNLQLSEAGRKGKGRDLSNNSTERGKRRTGIQWGRTLISGDIPRHLIRMHDMTYVCGVFVVPATYLCSCSSVSYNLYAHPFQSNEIETRQDDYMETMLHQQVGILSICRVASWINGF